MDHHGVLVRMVEAWLDHMLGVPQVPEAHELRIVAVVLCWSDHPAGCVPRLRLHVTAFKASGSALQCPGSCLGPARRVLWHWSLVKGAEWLVARLPGRHRKRAAVRTDPNAWKLGAVKRHSCAPTNVSWHLRALTC